MPPKSRGAGSRGGGERSESWLEGPLSRNIGLNTSGARLTCGASLPPRQGSTSAPNMPSQRSVILSRSQLRRPSSGGRFENLRSAAADCGKDSARPCGYS